MIWCFAQNVILVGRTAKFQAAVIVFLWIHRVICSQLLMITAYRTYKKWILKMKLQLQTLTVAATCVHLTAQLRFQAAVIMI